MTIYLLITYCLKVSCTLTSHTYVYSLLTIGRYLNIQTFNDIFNAAIFSVPVCGEDVEVTERFPYLDSDVRVSAGCESEVNRHLGLAGESWIHWTMGCGAAGTCAGGEESKSSGPRCFQSFSTEVRLGL